MYLYQLLFKLFPILFLSLTQVMGVVDSRRLQVIAQQTRIDGGYICELDNKSGATETVVAKLITSLKNPNPIIRACAAYALNSIGKSAKSAVPVLTSLLRDSDPNVRRSAAHALASIEGPAAAPKLITLLQDSNPLVRNTAILALNVIWTPSKSAIPSLIPLLKDSEPNIRAWAAATLGEIGEPAKVAIPDLIQLLQDSDESVVEVTKTVLMKFGYEQSKCDR